MRIQYCGDDEFASPYILGALENLGHMTTYIPVNQDFHFVDDCDAIILSDYPATRISPLQADAIRVYVEAGGRLLMLGGWESFNGFGGNYYHHPVGDLLPVALEAHDDRRNVSQGLIVERTRSGEFAALDWSKPPVICGYNAARPKKDAEVLVAMKPVVTDGEAIRLGPALPLVVKAAYGTGTAVACLTDLAPHWCGGLVDWGHGRIQLSTGKEVGSDYPKFFELLLTA